MSPRRRDRQRPRSSAADQGRYPQEALATTLEPQRARPTVSRESPRSSNRLTRRAGDDLCASTRLNAPTRCRNGLHLESMARIRDARNARNAREVAETKSWDQAGERSLILVSGGGMAAAGTWASSRYSGAVGRGSGDGAAARRLPSIGDPLMRASGTYARVEQIGGTGAMEHAEGARM
jgi:hypothetical protein